MSSGNKLESNEKYKALNQQHEILKLQVTQKDTLIQQLSESI